MIVRPTRRQFLSAAGASAVASSLPARILAAPAMVGAASGQNFSFIFFTDTHTQPELNAVHGTALAFRKAREIHADLAIQGGDLVFDAAGVGRNRALALFDLYAKVEQDLGRKVYHTLGNHDVVGMVGTAIPSDDPVYGKKLFEERYGATHYSFDHKGHHFIILDSIEMLPNATFEGRIAPGQLQWLASDFASLPSGMPIVVVVHIPLVTSMLCLLGPKALQHASQISVVNAAEVIALFEGRNVLGVLQGHTHVNETVLWKGVPYITSGAVSGGWWRGSHLGTPEGFTVVDIVNGRLSTRYEASGFQSVASSDPQPSR